MHVFLNELAGMVERLPRGADIGDKARKEIVKPANMVFGNYASAGKIGTQIVFRAKLRKGVKPEGLKELFAKHEKNLAEGEHYINAHHYGGYIQIKMPAPDRESEYRKGYKKSKYYLDLNNAWHSKEESDWAAFVKKLEGETGEKPATAISLDARRKR